uniref:Putative nucleoside-diphosphate-sugar epimerase n=1 Tax=Pseudomonas nitroreducens TaxID=46680 RepID=C3VA28_PSENT|nr:putative nucleoside-diphosphate-sugar epimerase [Pseudomonas nitroreducens]
MIAITAGTGNLGQAIVERLGDCGLIGQVRLTARDPKRLRAAAEEGFQVAKADYTDIGSLDQALQGVEVLLLISGTAPNEIRIQQHKSVIDAAKRNGVSRIVYTSFINPSTRSRSIWAAIHRETETYLRQSGVKFTIVRNNQYASNLDQFLLRAQDSGIFAIPGAKGRVAYVSHRDVAAAICSVLTTAGHDNRIYQLTGAEALNGLEIAEILGGVLGRPVRAMDASPDEFAASFREAGFPEFMVEGLLSIYAASGAGEYQSVSPDVGLLTGRRAESMRTYIQRLVWP